LTGTFGGCFANSAHDRAYPFTYTISAANTWEQKTITVVGDTSGTWIGATNGAGIRVYFNLGSGATVSGTAGAWTTGFFVSATGATSVVGTSGATFYITGVQLELGTVATPFERRPVGLELALSQRYFETSGINAYGTFFNGNVTNAVVYYSARTSFAVTKRASPSVTYSNFGNSSFPATPVPFTVDATGHQEQRTANATANSGIFGSSWTASAEL